MSKKISDLVKSYKTLYDFVRYCLTHPEERFWQALRNWSGYYAIMAIDRIGGTGGGGQINSQHNTFYIEGKRHDDKES